MQAIIPKSIKKLACSRLDSDVTLYWLFCSDRTIREISSMFYSRRSGQLRTLLWATAEENICERHKKPTAELYGTAGYVLFYLSVCESDVDSKKVKAAID